MGQHAVNIVYPIDGEKFPKIDSDCKVEVAYFAASFSVTCNGGPNIVEWGFDRDKLGEASFYDEFSAQFTWKLSAGLYTFWVASERCGKNQVKFEIG